MAVTGFIETKGLVDNIEATDAILKAADVELMEADTIGADLVTVVVTGEMRAVKAATEAGIGAASRMGELLAIHVIPRPHTGTAKVLPRPNSTAE